MLTFRVACYTLLVILLSKEITGRSPFGFDIFGGYDDESYDDKDTNLMEKNGKIFPDWITSIFDFFYDDTDDGDDKYLICKNCTVIVGENQSHTSTQASSSTTQAATTVTTNVQSSTEADVISNDQSSSSSTSLPTDSTDGSTPNSGQ